MEHNFYIRFSDCPKSLKVSSDVFLRVLALSKYYKCFLSTVRHRFGSTLFVSYSHFFFHCQLYPYL